MLSFLRKNHIYLFYTCWFLLNVFQAYHTELFDDEAYYWVYSKFPDWGYFDHPPMVALLIKAGYSIFHNELGVRFLMPFINTACVFILQQLLQKKDDLLFYAIATSVIVLQLAGMLAIPDSPLVFFATLFFWSYGRFLKNMNAANAILFGTITALMLYSKYHGLLIVIFTLASNLRLFRSFYPYLAGLTALILFLPHLYWQYAHDFPSIWFHLFERNVYNHSFFFFAEYLFGQIIFAGPVIGWLLIWCAFAYKTTSPVERALKFSTIGVYAFFFISSLKEKVEANWTVPALVGLIVLSHQYLTDHRAARKWLYRSLPLTLLVIITLRVSMMLDARTSSLIPKDECHENKATAQAIEKLADGLPVVITDSYQKPSKYWFYTGQIAYSLNTPDYRRNNYNFWPIEDSLIGKPAYVIAEEDPFLTDSIPGSSYKHKHGKKIDNYFSFSKVQVSYEKAENIDRSSIHLACKVESPQNYLPLFQQAPYDTASLYIAVYKKGETDASWYIPSGFTVKQITKTKMNISISGPHQLNPGRYRAKMAISSCIPGYPSVNGGSFYFEIK